MLVKKYSNCILTGLIHPDLLQRWRMEKQKRRGKKGKKVTGFFRGVQGLVFGGEGEDGIKHPGIPLRENMPNTIPAGKHGVGVWKVLNLLSLFPLKKKKKAMGKATKEWRPPSARSHRLRATLKKFFPGTRDYKMGFCCF